MSRAKLLTARGAWIAIEISILAIACTSPQPAPTNAPAADAHAYAIDTQADACARASDCAFRIRLTALGDYHVNPDYPHRFLPASDAGLEFTADRDFSREGEKKGTLAVHFRSAEPGTKKIAGTFKLSVCNPDQCKIEEAPIALEIAVK